MTDIKRNWQGLNGNEARQKLGQCHSNWQLAEALKVMVPALGSIEIDDTRIGVAKVSATVPVPVNPKLAALLRSAPQWVGNDVHRASKKKTPGAGATEVKKVKPRA